MPSLLLTQMPTQGLRQRVRSPPKIAPPPPPSHLDVITSRESQTRFTKIVLFQLPYIITIYTHVSLKTPSSCQQIYRAESF